MPERFRRDGRPIFQRTAARRGRLAPPCGALGDRALPCEPVGADHRAAQRWGEASRRAANKQERLKMKLKIDWKALGKALWNAVKPVLLGAVGGGVIALTDGCSSMTPSSKTQTMGVYAIGVPGIAIITQSTQNEDASGGDANAPSQTNPVTTTMTTGK